MGETTDFKMIEYCGLVLADVLPGDYLPPKD